MEDAADNSHLRWTVDTAEDLEHVRQLYRELELADNMPSYREMLRRVMDRKQGRLEQ